MDRFSTCTFPDCQLPSVRGFGPCERCNHLLCAEHRRLPFHACDDAPLPEDRFDTAIQTEVQTLRAQINEEALCSRASTLNSGRKCSISHPPAWGRGSLMGCANYHARIHHDDGSTWLLRVPRMNGSLPQSLIDYLVKSEYATLVFLEGTKVPAPRVFDYGIAGEEGNEVGVSYILMEQMPGKPWNGQGPRGKRFADEQDKERVWSGLADILIELRRYPFSRAGSLLPGPGPEPLISATASERFLVLSPSGPFDTAGEYLTAFPEQNMALIADGQLFTAFPVNAYLIFSFLKDQIPHLLATDNLPTESFYLKHVDDKGDHLLVDDDLNITGMIDWQMARIVPAIEAFGPSLVTADMSDIYNGVSPVTGYDRSLAHYLREKGACDLAGLMSRHERLRRLFFGLDVDFAWDEALGLVRGIWAAFGGGEGDLDWGVWKVDLLRGCGHDERLERIIARWGLGP